MGAIRRTPSAPERFARKLERQANGCLLWKGAVGSHGYGNFWDGERFVLAHQFAYEQSRRRRIRRGRKGPVVMHDCPSGDNKLCCEPTHLIRGTHAKNHADARSKGRAPHMVSIFSEAERRDMLRRWKAGETQQTIADALGITQGAVSALCSSVAK
jgi:DNA-binding CsgD family transcriptional regulator